MYGLNPVNETYSQIQFDAISVRDLTFDRNSQVFTFKNFIDEMGVSISLTNSEFLDIQMNSLGKLFLISHQSKSTFLMENITINNTLSEGIHFNAADKQRKDIKLKVQIINMTASHTQNSYSALIKVFENSEL